MKRKLVISSMVFLSLFLTRLSFAEFGTGAFGEFGDYLNHIETNIIPSLTDSFDVGSATKEMRNGYFSGTVQADTLASTHGDETITGATYNQYLDFKSGQDGGVRLYNNNGTKLADIEGSGGAIIGQTNLLCNGMAFANGVSSQLVSTVVTLTTSVGVSYGVQKLVISTKTLTIPNATGKTGQVMFLIGGDRISGTLTIVANKTFGWSSATMDANGEQMTLLWINDTYGWKVIDAQGTTVTYSNF